MDTTLSSAVATNRTVAWTAVGVAGAHLAIVFLAFMASLENSEGWGPVFAMMAGAAALPVLPGLLVGLLVARSPEPSRAGAVAALVLAVLPPLVLLVILSSSGL